MSLLQIECLCWETLPICYFFNVLINNHNKSYLITLSPIASTVEVKQRQKQHNGACKYIKSTGAQYRRWRGCFLSNNSCILGRPGGRGSNAQVDIPHHFLDACCATLRASSSPHIFRAATSSTVMEQRFQWQQVWGQGGLSKDVKSMEDSLMSFPLPFQTKGAECRRMLVDMLQMEEIRSPE